MALDRPIRKFGADKRDLFLTTYFRKQAAAGWVANTMMERYQTPRIRPEMVSRSLKSGEAFVGRGEIAVRVLWGPLTKSGTPQSSLGMPLGWIESPTMPDSGLRSPGLRGFSGGIPGSWITSQILTGRNDPGSSKSLTEPMAPSKIGLRGTVRSRKGFRTHCCRTILWDKLKKS